VSCEREWRDGGDARATAAARDVGARQSARVFGRQSGLDENHGRGKTQKSERHGEGDREVDAETKERHDERGVVEIRDAKSSAQSIATQARGFSAVMHIKRDITARAEEEGARSREDVLSREGYRVFASRAADGEV